MSSYKLLAYFKLQILHQFFWHVSCHMWTDTIVCFYLFSTFQESRDGDNIGVMKPHMGEITYFFIQIWTHSFKKWQIIYIYTI